MPPLSAAEITALCQKCYDAHTPNPDAPNLMNFGPPEPFRLLNNGAIFHEMAFDELVAALVGLNKLLLHPGAMIFQPEHYFLWSWCAELLIGGQATAQPLYRATVRAALATAPPRVKLPGNDPQSVNATEFLSNANVIFSHLSFPLLEFVCKRACSQYVTIDGKVIIQFDVPGKLKLIRYKPGDDCSSLRDLLWLHHNYVALATDFKMMLEEFKTQLTGAGGKSHGYYQIQEWRNSSLHGTATFQFVGGVVLNLATLISLFNLQPTFDKHRVETLRVNLWNSQSPLSLGWRFYPPF
jgi:hypothetical protein